ncbi:SusC/RagA family TonB-linked outer membrane protein [Bacteroidia bacterium]|nr:SusC/RagA family TonB-linked outer membrane protein [Bacteroidia bacterium]
MNKLKIKKWNRLRRVFYSCLFVSCSFSLFAQVNQQVTGLVTDENGEPLIGVSISVKGTSSGTVTDTEGRYSLATEQGKTLLFSYLGYAAVEKTVDKPIIDAVLKENTADLGEVIVVGYGTQKKSDLTGSVTSLKASSLEKRPVASIDALLQGKVAGLRITQSSGEPGAGVSVQLRGISSRAGSNSPLYVVDGFPYGDAGNLKQFNINDIESIEVLKDASAASIYGSRGANGVILITTKSGGIDKKPTISASANVGVQQINTSNFAIIKDPFTYALLADEASVNDSRIGVPKYIGGVDSDGFYYPSLTELSEGTWDKTTDWEDLVLRSAIVQNYNISVVGGGKSNAYLFSGSYYQQEGTVIGSGYNNLTARLKFDQIVSPSLKLGSNMSFSYVDRDPALIGYASVYRNPVFPVYNDDGSYYKENPTDFSNPIMVTKEVKNHSDEYDVNMLAYAEWNPVKELSIRGQSGLKYGLSDANQYYPRTTTLGNIHEGEADRNLGSTLFILSDIYGTYKKIFAEVHDFSAMLGFVNEMTQWRGYSMIARGFPSDNITNENMSMGNPQKNEITNGETKEMLNSFIARINYIYDNRYLATFTGRYDGSSKFGDNNKYAFFPSLALGWKLSEENFLKDRTNWLSDLKLRASYGSTGNQAITVYGTMDKISGDINDKYYMGNTLYSGLGITQMGNKGLKWETTTQANIGLDFGVFQNAVTLTADVYDKKSTGLLRQLNLPLSGGIGDQHSASVGKVWINSGEIRNKGVEIGVNAHIISAKDLSWSVNLTAAHNQSVVTDIGEEGESLGLLRSRAFSDGGVYWRNGEPMDLIVGYRNDGIIQEGDVVTYLSGDDAKPGEFKYRNVNDDNQISLAEDGVVLGNAQPNWVGGIGTSLVYKGFDLDIQMNGVTGVKIISSQRFSRGKQINRWTVDNPTDKFPSLRGGRTLKLSDWWIENGDYLRISNITLGYNFKTGNWKDIQNFRIYFSCSNPYVFTKFSGIDPEVSIFDSGSYPKPATFSIGINIQF